jgi:hypothetical protein
MREIEDLQQTLAIDFAALQAGLTEVEDRRASYVYLALREAIERQRETKNRLLAMLAKDS